MAKSIPQSVDAVIEQGGEMKRHSEIGEPALQPVQPIHPFPGYVSFPHSVGLHIKADYVQIPFLATRSDSIKFPLCFNSIKETLR